VHVALPIAEVADGQTSLTAAHDLAVRRALEAAGVEFIDGNGGGPGVRLRKAHRDAHPDWINSHALETGLTISHLRGASDPGMPTGYDGEDRTRALAGETIACWLHSVPAQAQGVAGLEAAMPPT
jgi:hypothetical protein